MLAAALDDPQAIRGAGRDLLSLALIDARNHLLAALGAFPGDAPPAAARRLALAAGAWQEHWIACHVQRQRGEGCDPSAPRLAGDEPQLAHWLDPAAEPPDAASVRGYLAQTQDLTLDLLAGTPEADAPLHFYRQALLHEDRLCEALAVLLQQGAPTARPQRPPLWLPAQTLRLGGDGAPGVPHNERGLLEVAVPEFEIDAQPVNWRQYAEFAADGGYDRRELWGDAGWAWLQAQAEGPDGARRAPRHVEQLGGAVLVQRAAAGSAAAQLGPARLVHAAAGQAAMHVSRFEAEAWCRWAGRRLPTEPEWQLAATTAASRGFAWGDVFEWVAGSARAWPGAPAAPPGCLDAIPPAGSQGVLRGASFATRLRRRHPQARRFALPAEDRPFFGFRSCSA